jgi:predicted nucleic acid-binding protein
VPSEPSGRLVNLGVRPITLVDSNVLLDVMTDDPAWGQWSADRITQALDDGRLVINPIVYAEVSIGFGRMEDLDDALPSSEFEREPFPYEAGFLAGKAYVAYRRRGGTRRSPMPDFYIGAHAAVRGYRLLTRDAKRYLTYFPGVDVVSPAG